MKTELEAAEEVKQNKRRAVELVENDITFDPTDLFWNERHTALITIIFTILVYSPAGIQTAVCGTPAELFEWLEGSFRWEGHYLRIFENDSDQIKHQAAQNVKDILERVLLSENQNEFVN